MRRTTRLSMFSLLGTGLLAAACVVVFVGDLEVSWTVDGGTSADKCAEYGIDKWEILLSGPMSDSYEFKCGDHWDSGDFFYNIDEGYYTITINALSVDGTILADDVFKDDFIDDGSAFWKVSFAFKGSDFTGEGPVCGDGTCDADEDIDSCPEDCTPLPDAKALISWKINGTTDGTETGPSWDNCAEVGAVEVAITLDGETTAYDCAAGGQSVTIDGLAPGTHDVSLVLLDKDGAEITTAAEDAIEAAVDPVEEVFDFPFNSFVVELKESISGDFLFLTLFENGLTCSATSPAVSGKITLLKLDGTPIDAEVCDPDSSCVATNGQAKGFCSDKTQSIGDLTWGAYKIRIAGVPAASTQVCWETQHPTDGTAELDILVGAGTENPVVDIMLDRVSDVEDCI